MGARKTSKKRNNPDRHRAFLALRDMKIEDKLVMFTFKDGHQQMINPMKKFLMRGQYTHPELKKEIMRLATKQAMGAKKYEEVTNPVGVE